MHCLWRLLPSPTAVQVSFFLAYAYTLFLYGYSEFLHWRPRYDGMGI